MPNEKKQYANKKHLFKDIEYNKVIRCSQAEQYKK